jgi:hypothetical protein
MARESPLALVTSEDSRETAENTAATCHFAHCGDAAKTPALLGERDIRTLLEHYKGLASKAEAEQFYALRPKVADGDWK